MFNISLGVIVELVAIVLLVAIAFGILPVKWGDKEENDKWAARHRRSFVIGALILLLDVYLRTTGVF